MTRHNRIPHDAFRRELLRLAHAPGCMVCHAEYEAVDRFFAWYLVEQYHEPPIIVRMQAARGFCPQHTRQFVHLASPHLVSTVYRDLLDAAVALLHSVECDASAARQPQEFSTRLRPQAPCLACEQKEAAVQRLVHALPAELGDTEVRAALARPAALCLPHFLRILPALDWASTRQLAHAQRASLSSLEAGGGDGGAERAARTGFLVGAEPDAVFVDQPPALSSMAAEVSGADDQASAAADIGIDPPDLAEMHKAEAPGAGSRNARADEQPAWSPTITRLHSLLGVAGCPLCRQEEDVAETYLGWLAPELTSAATGQAAQAADDALWLCRDHLWRFIRTTADEQAVAALLTRALAYWAGILHTLVSALDRPPPRSFLARCWHGIVNARRGTSETSGTSGTLRLTLRGALREGVREGRRSPADRLSDLRASLLRPHPCPVCRFQHERTERVADLLHRALADLGTAQRYQAASGLCFRHLPLAAAITSRGAPDTARLLLQTERTRLAVLHWELDEYWRKRDWAHRWELKGDEQGAWHRALAQYSGVSAGPLAHSRA